MPDEAPIIPLDTSEWAEPTTEFVGKVTKSEFRTTDDATGKDGRTFTETRGLPRAIRTWHVEVERFDALFDLPDGENAPVTAYMTVDLERLTDGTISPVARGQNKATFVTDKWAEAGLRLGVSPEKAVGVNAEFTLLRTKMFSGMAAKDILYPTKILPQDFKYEGDVRHFQVKGDQSLADFAEEAQPTAAAEPTAEVDVASLLVGLNADDPKAVNAFIKEHPEIAGDVRVDIVTGDYVEALIKDGKLKKSKAGVLAAV